MANQPPFAEYPRPGGGPSSAGTYHRGPGIYIEAIGESFNLVKQDLGHWVAATLLYFALAFGLSLPISMITGPMMAQTTPGAFPVAGFALNLVLNLVVTAIEGCILVGMIAMGVRKSRGEYINVSMVFEPFRSFGAILGSNLLYYLIVYAALIACILPAFFFGPALFLMPVVAFMLNQGPFQALKTTFAACKRHWAGLFGLLFILGLLQFLGLIVCGVGLLVTFPMYCVAIGIHYRAFFESGGPQAATY